MGETKGIHEVNGGSRMRSGLAAEDRESRVQDYRALHSDQRVRLVEGGEAILMVGGLFRLRVGLSICCALR